ncbi:MAG: Na+/H+ antiporter NhaA [Chlorobiales bacterium]
MLFSLNITKLFKEFTESNQSSGLLLLVSTMLSLLLANVLVGEAYINFWHEKIGFQTDYINLKHSLEHWINDGLMAIFFLLVGLEIEREIYAGELSDLRKAVLPISAALGGMLLPAAIHLVLNSGTETKAGFGIPMATDIAFALGCLAMVGKNVPIAVKVFLTALAIIDDLGAIIVIAIFYSKGFSLAYFLGAIGLFAFMLILNRLKIDALWSYLVLGVVMWYCMLESGIHATIAGVLLAFAIPFRDGSESSPSYRLQHALHTPVLFVIMPIFALANTCIIFSENWWQGLVSANSIGIFLGLFVGKSVGILGAALLTIKLSIAEYPRGTTWKHFFGAGFLGGIGFTMSIFITVLAFENNPEVVAASKISVLMTSVVSGLVGFMILKHQPNAEVNDE